MAAKNEATQRTCGRTGSPPWPSSGTVRGERGRWLGVGGVDGRAGGFNFPFPDPNLSTDGRLQLAIPSSVDLIGRAMRTMSRRTHRGTDDPAVNNETGARGDDDDDADDSDEEG